MVCLAVKEDATLQLTNFYLLLLGKDVILKVTGTKLSSITCNRISTVFFFKDFKIFPSQYILKSLLQASCASSDS
jgi:hypothetical protein